MGLDISVTKCHYSKEGDIVDLEELAYFRKVNCLIPHFEKWLGCEIDNCEDYPITRDMCLALVENCQEILLHPELASTLLPTCEGFFFGSTEYDDWYFDNLHQIITQFTEDVIPEFDKLDDSADIIFCISY